MNYNKIRLLTKERKLSIRKLCVQAGITDVGFRKMTEKNTMKIETLEKIAKALDVSPVYFFDTDGKPEDYQVKDKPGDYERMEPVNLKRENELLKELIKEKDKRLKLYEENHNS